MFVYTRDVKLSFPNNSIKKKLHFKFLPSIILCHSFDQCSGELPIYIYYTIRIPTPRLWMWFELSNTPRAMHRVTLSPERRVELGLGNGGLREQDLRMKEEETKADRPKAVVIRRVQWPGSPKARPQQRRWPEGLGGLGWGSLCRKITLQAAGRGEEGHVGGLRKSGCASTYFSIHKLVAYFR